MSFKQRSSPLKQGIMSGFNAINNAVSGLNPNSIINNGMTAAQIAYSNTPAGQAANSITPAVNTPVTNNSQVVTTPTTVSPVTTTAPTTTVRQRGRNWFGAVPTNTVNGGPQSVMQGTHGSGINRRDSHNTTYADRTNYQGHSSRSSMFSPFPQLKKEQMEYNKISPKAFSNAGTIGKMMGKSIPNSPFMQMIDPLTGNQIDPTMNQDPNAPVANNPGTPIPPPLGVQVPTTPVYDINQ